MLEMFALSKGYSNETISHGRDGDIGGDFFHGQKVCSVGDCSHGREMNSVGIVLLGQGGDSVGDFSQGREGIL